MASGRELQMMRKARERAAGSIKPKDMRAIGEAAIAVSEAVEATLNADPAVRADTKRLDALYAELADIRKHEHG